MALGSRGRVPNFCSTRCRVAAHRARNSLPLEMINSPRWVRHDRKRPTTSTGRAASSTDARTWTTHALASASPIGDGLGFVLGQGIACLDLDHCLVDGELARWAQAIVDSVPGAYVEVSPSGTGIHIWGRAPEGPGTVLGNVECYSVGRYITVTGNVFQPGGLVDLGEFF